MGKGRRYELELCQSLSTYTPDDVWVFTPDRSGASATAVCDLGVVWTSDVDDWLHGKTIEVKKRQGDAGYRTVVVSGSSSGQTGVEELQTLVDGTPQWAVPLLAVKFDHRQLATFNADRLLSVLDGNETGNRAPYDAFDPRVTGSGSISLVKPTTDDWPSAQAGLDDVNVLSRGVPE